jgi:hypothetical protein
VRRLEQLSTATFTPIRVQPHLEIGEAAASEGVKGLRLQRIVILTF